MRGKFPGAKAVYIEQDLAEAGYQGFRVQLTRNIRTQQWWAQVYQYGSRLTAEMYSMFEPTKEDWIQLCLIAQPLAQGGKAVTIGERIK